MEGLCGAAPTTSDTAWRMSLTDSWGHRSPGVHPTALLHDRAMSLGFPVASGGRDALGLPGHWLWELTAASEGMMVETDGLPCGEQTGRTKGALGAWEPRGPPHKQGRTGSTRPRGLRMEMVVGGERAGLPRRGGLGKGPQRGCRREGKEQTLMGWGRQGGGEAVGSASEADPRPRPCSPSAQCQGQLAQGHKHRPEALLSTPPPLFGVNMGTRNRHRPSRASGHQMTPAS